MVCGPWREAQLGDADMLVPDTSGDKYSLVKEA